MNTLTAAMFDRPYLITNKDDCIVTEFTTQRERDDHFRYLGTTELKRAHIYDGLVAATHSNERSGDDTRLIVHYRGEGFEQRNPRKKFKCEAQRYTTPGGYWDGSRVYTGYLKKSMAPQFVVSVVDSGEGTHLFQEWLRTNKVEVTSYRESVEGI